MDIIKDPREVDGKSTAVHAAVLAPHDVTVYQFPDIPDYTNLMQVILLLHAEFQLRGVFKKFCDMTINSSANSVKYNLFLNIVPAKFDAFVALFCHIVYAVNPCFALLVKNIPSLVLHR